MATCSVGMTYGQTDVNWAVARCALNIGCDTSRSISLYERPRWQDQHNFLGELYGSYTALL